jgi:multisubunit Na+/H+ antiporter MnhF subunit
VIAASFALLALATVAFTFRLCRGPSLADRIVSVDGLLMVGAAAIVVNAVRTGSGAFLPVVIVIALVGFVGTSILARFIEGREP